MVEQEAQPLSGKVRVAIRVRPLLSHEDDHTQRELKVNEEDRTITGPRDRPKKAKSTSQGTSRSLENLHDASVL
jgi:hypothetical protein